ncbi:hypothetical protein EB837_12900 [Kluyvera ascorbata]|uniref:Uncharacterized protein n=1 Tax=Kluyvera ascorbata TaxID=51288 RepID=A0A3N2S291_9ENTR|nr:hypothetical protein [Kluyvera ascorbata]ROU13813.1 hypothetical protein EB837_12900 [Kluyvera ascorbata]
MNQLTTTEAALITRKLKDISDTWSDLWVFLHLVPIVVSRAIDLRYSCFDGKSLTFEERGKFKAKQIAASPLVCELIQRRREKYPDDIFIFQSHSNRVRRIGKPVTVIAFNRALKSASKGVTEKTVSSKSAQW